MAHEAQDSGEVVTREVNALKFNVEFMKGTPESVDPDGGFYASIPQRSILYYGKDRDEAIGHMLYGLMDLARDGSIDPDHPERVGLDPIQHTMSILQRKLEWQLERRRESLEHESESKGPGETIPISPSVKTSSDIISQLGTAIAALARVQSL